MADPTAAVAGAVLTASAAGITLFGIATGLQPEFLLAGFSGGLAAISISAPMSWMRRVVNALLSSIMAGFFVPAISVLVAVTSFWPKTAPLSIIQFPIAVLIGFGWNIVFAPKLASFLTKKADEVANDV